MGNSRWFFSFSGVILADRRDRDRDARASTSASTSSRGTRITAPLEQAGERRPGARRARRRSATATPRSRASTTRSSATNVVQIAVAELDPARSTQVEDALDRTFGVARADFTPSSIGPTFGEQIARTARDRRHRLAAPDLALHRLPLRVEVRRAGADRARARPADHGGRLRALRAGGHDRRRSRRCSRSWVTRSTTRSSCSTEYARTCRACRAPPSRRSSNRSMSEVFTRSLATSFVRADAGARAAPLRRRDAEGLRVRAAGRHRSRAPTRRSSSPRRCSCEWKEREPTYMRRRRLMLQEHGGHMPAFATGGSASRRWLPPGAPAPRPAPRSAAAAATRRRRPPPPRGAPRSSDRQAPQAAARRPPGGSRSTTTADRPPTPPSQRAPPERAAGARRASARPRRRPRAPPADGAGDGDGSRRDSRSPSQSRSASRSAESTGGADHGDGRVGDDGNRGLALHRVRAGPLLGRDRRRVLPRRSWARRSSASS